METVAYLFQCAFNPSDATAIKIFYFIWIGGYCIIHIMWDAASAHTDKFEFSNLQKYAPAIYNATTLTSSILVLIAIFNEHIRNYNNDIVVHYILAGLPGILVSMGQLKPKYDPTSMKSTSVNGTSATLQSD